MKQEISDRFQKDAQNYIKPLSLTMWNVDVPMIESQINSILNNPDISGVRVVGNISEQIYSAGEIPDREHLQDYIVFLQDISHSTNLKIRRLGTLYLYLKKQQLYALVFSHFIQDLSFFIILVVIFIASSLFSYNRTINTPLKKLLKSIRKFDDIGDISPVEWSIDDEIGEVISSYNGLIVTIEMSHSQLMKALEDARNANKIKSEFLANMSHEIRTPLNGIQGLADIVLDTPLEPEQKKFLKTIYLESEQLLDIINDILDFSKIEAGRMELEKIPFNLRHTIENLCAPLSIQADKKGIELIHYLNSDAPTDLIGDPGRIRQILVNLIGNSIKFTSEGEVFLYVQMIKQTDQTVLFNFSVKDTGIGIPEDKQDTIFESFSQADGSTTRRFGGTGLGITISKMLVEQMGGAIGLESEDGEGSLFYFNIEFSKQKNLADAKESPLKINFNGLNIMVVDDVKTSSRVITGYLESWGCKTMSADSDDNALNMLRSCQANDINLDIIFLDCQMPDTNVFELAQTIKKIETFKNTPIALLTSVGRAGEGKQCRDIKLDGYLTKPICPEDLKIFVSFIMGQGADVDDLDKILITRHTLAETKRQNIQVLLVEDYETNQVLATKQLKNAGYHVTLASDGQEAVNLFPKKKFDVVLMDIQMPKMDGYEACNLIREMEGDEHRTPIVAMTAHAMEGYRQQCLDAGMDDYITKPLKKETLLSTVSKWVQKSINTSSSYTDILIGEDEISDEINGKPFDFKKALFEFENDEEFFYEVFDDFLERVDQQMKTIEKAIESNDFKTLKDECHAIKGGAANLTAMPLSMAAFELEKMGRDQKPDSDKIMLNEMTVKFEELCDFRKTLNGKPE